MAEKILAKLSETEAFDISHFQEITAIPRDKWEEILFAGETVLPDMAGPPVRFVATTTV